jgi:hypothetical protein
VKTVRILKKNRQRVSRAQAEKKHLRESSSRALIFMPATSCWVASRRCSFTN